MSYSYSTSKSSNNNDEMYSMNTSRPNDVLEYSMGGSNNGNSNSSNKNNNNNDHDLHLMDNSVSLTKNSVYDLDNDDTINSGAIVVVDEDNDDVSNEKDKWNYSNKRKNKNKKNVVPWYKRKLYIGVIIIVLLLIIVISSVVSSKRKQAEYVSSLQPNTSGRNPKGGPYIALSEVDQNVMQSNIDTMVGDFLATTYSELKVPNWNEALQSTTSPQGLALRWITGRAYFDSISQLARKQRYALAVFYYSTYQVNHEFMTSHPKEWISASKWISDESECQWEGIVCDGNSAVTSIILANHDLSGSIPHEVAMLAESLTKLDLISNYIYMEDTSLDVFIHMKNLKVLRMEDNFIVSINGLPTQFSHLKSIESIQLSYNLLQGKMNGTIFKSLHQLQLLEIESNYLSGSLPSELSTLPNLVYLYARRNMLEFRLDQFITGNTNTFPQLFSLWLDSNTIMGTIPTTVGLLTGLASFSITNSTITGTIPTEFGILTNMKRIWLYDNQLNGTIPAQLSNLQQLEVFEIHNNNIIGTMPSTICQYVSQSDYDLSTVSADCTKISCECCTVCY